MRTVPNDSRDEFILDKGTRVWIRDDGSFYIATGDDYYDVDVSPELARGFSEWLRSRLAEKSK